MQISIEDVPNIRASNPSWIDEQPVVIEGKLLVSDENIVITYNSSLNYAIDVDIGARVSSCAAEIDGENVYVFGVLRNGDHLSPVEFIESASTGSRYCIDSTTIDEISSRSRF